MYTHNIYIYIYTQYINEIYTWHNSPILDPLQDEHTNLPSLCRAGGARGERRGIQRQHRGLQQRPAVAPGAPAAAAVPRNAVAPVCFFCLQREPSWKTGISIFTWLAKHWKVRWNDWVNIGNSWKSEEMIGKTLDMIWKQNPGKCHPGNVLGPMWLGFMQEACWDCNAATNDTRVLILYCHSFASESSIWSWTSAWVCNSCDADRQGVV